jgi:hypothetical protein
MRDTGLAMSREKVEMVHRWWAAFNEAGDEFGVARRS